MDEKETYIKHKRLDDDYYMKLIEDYLKKFNVASRVEIENCFLINSQISILLPRIVIKRKIYYKNLRNPIRLNDKHK